MFKKVIRSFNLALGNIRSRLMHTLLSVLGIVIGVGALVAILSMIDGMEKYATDQVSGTTSLNAVIIRSEKGKRVDGVYVRKDSVAFFDYEQFKALTDDIDRPFTPFIITRAQKELQVVETDSTYGVVIQGTGLHLNGGDTVVIGRSFTQGDMDEAHKVAIINHKLAQKLIGEDADVSKALGQSLKVQGRVLEVIGVLKEQKKEPVMALAIPITLYDRTYLANSPPSIILWANTVEDVEAIEKKTKAWVEESYGQNKGDFSILINSGRIKQITKAFLVFRIVMGFIVGISVIVGGIGVMNVLLISVTERTSEIGVRKALGANRKDITMQFLSEAIMVSLFGSFVGVLLGIGVTQIAIPIIKHIAKVPFQAAYTWEMLLTVGIIAVVVGIVFGTYPAIRASRLDPVEAIRRE